MKTHIEVLVMIADTMQRIWASTSEKGYKALEELEGLDLFWICDPMIKLVKESEVNND